MLTNCIICIPIPGKSAYIVVNAYLKEVYCRFGGSQKILSHNGSELKNSLFSKVATQVGIKHSFSSPNRFQASGHIESSHKFFKNCIRKFTMKGVVEWDEVVNIAYASYKLFPNGHGHG